jgi:hypothetical protein
MAWTAPMTATSGAALSASDFNTYVRDNLNMTAPALATTAGAWFTSSAANTLVQRTHATDVVTTAESTSSTSYTDLTTPGPSVTVTTGTFAVVTVHCGVWRSGSTTASGAMSFAISGATTSSATDDRAAFFYGYNNSSSDFHRYSVSSGVNLTAGSNTFTAKYKAASNAANFSNRRITVWTF